MQEQTTSKTNSFVKGAFILVVATGLVKAIGALFKIPLANLLGGEGMGYFSTAYGLFNPIYAVSVGGFPIALSSLVSQYAGLGRGADIRKAYQMAWLLFGAIGLAGFAAIWLLAEPFCTAAANPGAVLSVRAMAPALLFCCCMSVWRGYHQGLGNMTPTAASQVVEACAKLALGIGGTLWVQRLGMEEFALSGTVFGTAAATEEAAHRLLLPYMAAGAVGGVALSTLCGAIFLLIYQQTAGRKTFYKLRPRTVPLSGGAVCKALASITLPVCLGAVVVSLTSIIDLFSVMNRLGDAVSADYALVAGQYRSQLPADALPNFLYGSYQGLAASLYTLLPTLTSSFGVSALPAVSRAWAAGDTGMASKNAETVLRIALLLTIPAGLGLSVLAEPILLLLYPSRVAEVAVAAPLLRILGIGGICLGIATPVNSMLQAIGRADLPVKLMLAGAAIKLTLNLVLIGQPSVNILGAPIGSLACYVFLAVSSVTLLCKSLSLRPKVGLLFRPLLAGGLCAATAGLVHQLAVRVLPGPVATLGGIAFGGAVYLAVLAAIGGIRPEDLPKSVREKLENSKKSRKYRHFAEGKVKKL